MGEPGVVVDEAFRIEPIQTRETHEQVIQGTIAESLGNGVRR